MHNIKSNKSGFSLIEMAVVIVIISFLAILFFFGSNVMESQRVNGVISEITYFRNAHDSFRDKFGYRPGDVSASEITTNFDDFADDYCSISTLGNGQWDNLTEEDLVWLQLAYSEYIRQDIRFDPCGGDVGREPGEHRPESGSINAAGWTYLNDVTFTHGVDDYTALYVLRLGKKDDASDTSLRGGQLDVRMASAVDAKMDSPNTPLTGRIFTSLECIKVSVLEYKNEGDGSKCTLNYGEVASEYVDGYTP
jgi:prepilin-type N-terminal cleavage/methylation domain-containing protein